MFYKPEEFEKNPNDPFTLARKLLESQQQHKQATGEFTHLLGSISTAIKFISYKCRRAGIANLYGSSGDTNATGDSQKKIDVLANEVLINCLSHCGIVGVMGSEEENDAIIVDLPKSGKYVVAFDPLDGSSNIDCNGSIGVIFGIWKRLSPLGEIGNKYDLLQSGKAVVAAGYAVFGSSTQLVLAYDNEVNGFTMDTTIGEFLLTHPHIKIKERSSTYSINEGNAAQWDEAITEYVHTRKFPPPGGHAYSLRYIGSFVADLHRTLLYGGVFMYPADKKCPAGKLRLLYECIPMAYIIHVAGGKAIDGTKDILEIVPKEIHQKCGIIIGSKLEVEEIERLYKKYGKDF